MRVRVRSLPLFSALALAGLVAACSDSGPTRPSTPLPLAGLRAGATNDSNTTPPSTQPSTPGTFRGTVMGHASFPAGTDTLAKLPRVAAATLVAYSHVQPTASDTLGIGPAAATVTTDANGQFQFPTLPGGLYIVTITPPKGSAYQGVWVVAIAHSHSADYAWWVVLPELAAH